MVFVSLLSVQSLLADESNRESSQFQTILARSTDPLAGLGELVSGILRASDSPYTVNLDPDPSMPLLVVCDKEIDQVPSLLLVVDLNHVEDAALSLSAWLSMFERYISDTDACSVAFSILPRTRDEKDTTLEAGRAFWMPVDPYQSLANLNATSVVLLDLVRDTQELYLEAEIRGRLSPLHVLMAVRASLEEMGLGYKENVVKALYARAGLIDGAAGLVPWLERGVPAVRLYGRLDEQIHFLPALMEHYQENRGSNWSLFRDVNYLRYQLPTAVISFGDTVVTRVILILLGVFMASVAVRPLLTRKHSLGPGALPEALVAYLFSFIAVSLSWLVHGLGARLFGSGALTIDMAPLGLAIGILGRLGSTLLFFFALSGLSARLGLLPHAVRGTASQASAMIAGILGMSILYFSIQGSLLLFGTMILLSLTGINAAVAMLSISVFVVILIPLVFSTVPVFVPGLVTVLNLQGVQLLLLAGFTAPIALWILTTLSPRHRLVRGDKTAPYLVAVALILCFLDPWLRTRL